MQELSHENLSNLYTAAYHLYRNGKYSQAKHLFSFLTRTCPGERKFWMGLGATYQLLKEYPEAIECYSVAALQNAGDPYAHWHAAECFFSDKQYSMSIKVLDSAIKVAKQDDKHVMLIKQLAIVHQAWRKLAEKTDDTTCRT